MAELRNCGVDDCIFNEYGECTAEYVEVDSKLTAAGFLPICQTYKEKDD